MNAQLDGNGNQRYCPEGEAYGGKCARECHGNIIPLTDVELTDAELLDGVPLAMDGSTPVSLNWKALFEIIGNLK